MPEITILMCTYNGSRFLEEQLISIENQTFKNWNIIVSDDKSIDKTVKILKEFQIKWGREKMQIVNGPGNGLSKNFLSLLCNSSSKSSYYAFADQDDIWDPNKLTKGIEFLSKEEPSNALLYCSRTKLIDTKNNVIGNSPLFSKKPSIFNALVQSIAGGNTMIFNRKTFEIVSRIGTNDKIVSHDWLIYLIVTSVSGKVNYDKWTSVFYRQHENNKIGNNMMFFSRIKRIFYFLRGDLKKWINQNLIILNKIDDQLSLEAKQAIKHLQIVRNYSWFEVIINLKKIKFYRQTYFGHIALIIGIIFKRL